jgi:ribonuclease J
MDELKVLATEAITANTNGGRIDWATIKNVIKSKLSNYLYQKTKRNPMILPIIMEI